MRKNFASEAGGDVFFKVFLTPSLYTNITFFGTNNSKESSVTVSDERTEGLMSAQVLPTALSILSAARSNIETKGEVTSNEPTCSSSDHTETSLEDLASRAHIMIQSLPADSDQTQEQDRGSSKTEHEVPENVTTSQQPGIITPVPTPSSTDIWSEEAAGSSGTAGPAAPPYRASRLWTISCNHPGGYYRRLDQDQRVAKKRRVVVEDTKPRWVTKIVLLGGCNSTTSTVHTIFHNIQPFSVVTGVTVVRDNLSHDILPEGKNNDAEWEECGSLSQLCYGCAATTAGTKAYVFGGKDANSQYLAEFQEFDMATNMSKRLARGPQPKEDAVAVRIGTFFVSILVFPKFCTARILNNSIHVFNS